MNIKNEIQKWKNFVIPGIVYSGGYEFADFCQANGFILEYSCDYYNINAISYNCTVVLGVEAYCVEDKFGVSYCEEYAP